MLNVCYVLTFCVFRTLQSELFLFFCKGNCVIVLLNWVPSTLFATSLFIAYLFNMYSYFNSTCKYNVRRCFIYLFHCVPPMERIKFRICPKNAIPFPMIIYLILVLVNGLSMSVIMFGAKLIKCFIFLKYPNKSFAKLLCCVHKVPTDTREMTFAIVALKVL